MKLSPKVSIITPIYNEGNNIFKCYQNILKQTYKNLEWIVVNDGSTDNSLEILENLVVQNQSNLQIILVSQENSGAAKARQTALTEISGEYATVLDCDDLYSDDAIEKAILTANSDPLIDIVCFQVDFLKNNIVTSHFNYAFSQWPISGRDAFKSTINGWGVTGWFLFKPQLMLKAYDEYHLAENNINNDEIISRLCLLYANKVSLCDGVYKYVYNPNSTTKSVNINFYKTLNNAIYLFDFIKNNKLIAQSSQQQMLLSNCWGIFSKFIKWKRQLPNKNDWISLLKSSLSKVEPTKLINFKKANLKALIQYIIIKVTLVCL